MWKVGLQREEPERETETETKTETHREIDLLSAASLPNSLSWTYLKPEIRSFFLISHMDAGAQELEGLSAVFLGHKKRTGSEAGQLGHTPAPIWFISAADLSA